MDQKDLGLNGRLITPEDASLYNEKRKVWNGFIDRYPSVIFECLSEEDVISAVKFANDNGLSVSIKGGGHHVAGTAVCDEGVMIDLSQMKKISVDEDNRLAIVQAGAILGEVDAATQQYGLATPTGTVSKTGIAGLALGGGIGYLRGKYGLTCDNLVEANLVTATGELITANKDENSDLFWAIRGGGGNFGVVTQFAFQLHPVGPEVFALDVMYDYKDVEEILLNLDAFMADIPDELSINLSIIQLPPAPFLPEFLHNKRVISLTGMYLGEVTGGTKEKVLQPLFTLAKPIMNQSGVMLFAELQKKLDPMVPDGAPVDGTSLFLNEINLDVIRGLKESIETAELPMTMVQIWALNGQMNRIPASETAFAVRDARYLLIVDAAVPMDQPQLCSNWLESLYQKLLPYSTMEASYINGVKVDATITKRTYGENFNRLAEIKAKYDPKNIFRHNHNIEPSPK